MTDRAKELLYILRDESNCNVLDYVDDAAGLIESLAAELEQVKQERDGLSFMLTSATSAAETYKRERDALEEDFKRHVVGMIRDHKGPYACYLCEHGKGYWTEGINTCPEECDGMNHWKLRGVKE